MEKRSKRIRSQQKKKRKKPSHSLPAVLAVSSLLISGLSQVSGETYASFNDKEGLSGQIKACEVFPKHIESQFDELITKIVELSSLSKDFYHYENKDFNFSHKVVATGDSIEELEQLAASYSTKIEKYESKKSSIQFQKRDFLQKKALIFEKVSEIYQLAREMAIYSQYDSNCTTIDKTIIHKKLTEELNDCLLLTNLTRNSINRLLNLFPSENGHPKMKQMKSNPSDIKTNLQKDLNTTIDDVLENLDKASSDVDQEIKRLTKYEKDMRKKADEKKQKLKEESISEEEKELTEENSEIADKKTKEEKETTTEKTESKKKENTNKDQETTKKEQKNQPAKTVDKKNSAPAEKTEKKKESEPAEKEEKQKSNSEENKDKQDPPPTKEEKKPSDDGKKESDTNENTEQ